MRRMEALHRRFDAVQDALMMHYETGSNALQAQIEYWGLTRKEQVMLFAARSKGYKRLGHTVVPTLAVAQAAAKGAIEMQLLCEKLAASEYNAEPWTMTDTSRETLLAPPQRCFKKRPCLVQVQFDGERGNEMWFTHWEDIYFLDEQDNWTKTKGRVNAQGLYYVNGGLEVYYADFAAEALKYSKNNFWTVTFQNQTLSSRQPAEDARESADPCIQGCDEADRAAGPDLLSRPPSTPPACFRPISKDKLPRSPSRYSRGPDRGEPPWSPGGSSYVSDSGSLCSGLPGKLSSPCSLSPSLSRSPLSSAASVSSLPAVCAGPACGSPCPTPAVEGTKTNEGIPAVLLKGRPNQLKCLRFRLKKTYCVHFWYITTTWFWAGPTGSDRAGRARMLVVFRSNAQRQRFQEKVPIPPGVERSEVSMADV
ncbi:putative E2 early protein [Equus caballus papillomavirus 6]|uniref:Regulatory protein E2 n=1 Tax=Equus caballus papillomavirus 6 TaxID=1235427 RepID=M4HWY6_9PAPI|nr:putative E2 early protein [Equus caballus papillomavirus 6]AFU07680.1 putative E2 early protein [Equus caballus papillomavirus 6]